VDKIFVGENVRNFLQLTPRNNSIILCNKYTFVGKRGNGYNFEFLALDMTVYLMLGGHTPFLFANYHCYSTENGLGCKCLLYNDHKNIKMIIFPSIFNTLHIFWQGPVGL